MTPREAMPRCVQCGHAAVSHRDDDLCADCGAHVAAKNVIDLPATYGERALKDHLVDVHRLPINQDRSGAHARALHAYDHDHPRYGLTHAHGGRRNPIDVAGDPHKIYDITGKEAEAGQHICLVEMPNDPDPIPVGATALIFNVVGGPLPQLWVKWEEPYENRTLCLTLGDRYVVLVD